MSETYIFHDVLVCVFFERILTVWQTFFAFFSFFSTEKKIKRLYFYVFMSTLSLRQKKYAIGPSHIVENSGERRQQYVLIHCPSCSLFLKVFFLLVIYCNMCQNVLTSIFFICYCYNRQMLYTTHRIPVCYSNSCKRSQFRPDCSLN